MKKGLLSALLALVLVASVLALPIIHSQIRNKNNTDNDGDKSDQNMIEKKNRKDTTENNLLKLISDRDVTYIVRLDYPSLLDTVNRSNGSVGSVKEFMLTEEGRRCCSEIVKNQAVAKASIQQLVTDADFDDSISYSAVINGFTFRAPAAAVSKLDKIDEIVNYYYSEDDDFFYDEINTPGKGLSSDTSRLSESFREVIHSSGAYSRGVSGKGMLISVLDSGFTLNHKCFSAAPPACPIGRDSLAALSDCIHFSVPDTVDPEELYHSEKIAFSFDYANNSVDPRENTEQHGTAVAAAAAGNNGESGKGAFRGVAYDAQLLLMKIAKTDFNNGMYAPSASVLAALDDSVKLGADVINMSFGAPRNSSNARLFDDALSRISKSGISVVCAAGNQSYNGSEYSISDGIPAADIDYATENYLAGANGVLSVGSASNSAYEQHYFTVSNTEFYYNDISEKELGAVFGDNREVPYIYLDGDGAREDYENASVEKKLVIVNMSSLPADRVFQNADGNGAGAVAVIGDDTEYFSGKGSWQKPFIVLPADTEKYFMSNPTGSINTNIAGKLMESEKTPGIINNTSYGFNNGLKPSQRVLACGDMVYSASADGKEDFFSGSSMAAAEASGACALLSQYIRENTHKRLSYLDSDKLFRSIMLSTATPVEYGKDHSGKTLYVSPRLQGAGVIDLERAVGAQAYLTDEENNPLSALLTNTDDEALYFDFRIHNMSGEVKTYRLDYVLQTDRYKTDEKGKAYNILKPYSLTDKSEAEFICDNKRVEVISIRADSYVTVRLKIKPGHDEISKLKSYFSNGFYLDGFIILTDSTDNTELHAPFTGIYGNTDTLDPFDNTVYDTTESRSGLENSLYAVAENIDGLSGCPLNHSGNIMYYSPRAVECYYDDSSFGCTYILPNFHFLRDVYELNVSIEETNGKSLFTCPFERVSAYRSRDHQPFEALEAGSASLEEFFSTLKDGTYVYRISARTLNSLGKLSPVFTRDYTFVVVTDQPKITGSAVKAENNRIILELSAKSNIGIRDFSLNAVTYSRARSKYLYLDKLSEMIEKGELARDAYSFIEQKHQPDGSIVYRYDITELSDSLSVQTFDDRCSSRYIVFRAFDNAYNASNAMVADIILYGRAEFSFKDQEGRPARDISITLNGATKTTDKKGTAVFEGIEPGEYLARLAFDNDQYDISRTQYLVSIGVAKTEVLFEEEVKLKLPYVEVSEEDSSEEPTEKVLTPEERELLESGADRPAVSLIFVGSLLIICEVSMLMRRRKTEEDPEAPHVGSNNQ